ncbi:leucine-rich repeat domain-containing protein [Adlercreutzia sp. ZJ304]|uniref:leucine-rich repeat domain-containing protein n=1 Tax=Adlercreutzia sp. ZJ304 TaxID=2709791 RepID=UPI0013EB38C2|nr:leucine-rich repeat domain-containing protein [Adlercreutzia sp. ZJ304]
MLGGGYLNATSDKVESQNSKNFSTANAATTNEDAGENALAANATAANATAANATAANAPTANGESFAELNPYTTEYFTDAEKAPEVTSITIPATVEEIDLAFFQLFPNAQAITVAEGNQNYKSNNGMLLDAAQTCLLLVPEGMEGAAVLPEHTASVPACVFSRCTKLSAIETGSAVPAHFITRNGLLYMQDLTTLVAAPPALGTSVVIAPECMQIASGAFWGNTALQTIVANGNVESIAMRLDNAELGVTGVAGLSATHANAVESEASIPSFNPITTQNAKVATPYTAAWKAAGFTNFIEPAKPGNTVSENGFTYTLLDDFTLAVGWTGEGKPEAELTIPEMGAVNGAEYSVSTITPEGFAGIDSIVVANIPASVIEIGNSAFANCVNLKTVHLPDTVQIIGAGAFENTALTTFVVPAQLQTIGEAALSGLNETTIVDLHGTADISPAALGSTTKASIYVPYNERGVYAWQPGLPTSGNAILPFGIKLGTSYFDMEVGQSASLFGGTGYIYAPGDAYATCRYPASAFSINAEAGTITARREGNMRFNIWLQLCLPEAQVDGRVQVRQIDLTTP